MGFTKAEKIILYLLPVTLIVCAAFGDRCENCKLFNSIFASYCNFCSGPLFKEETTTATEPVVIPPEEAILGQWKTLFEYYYEYEFFADGTCKGYYCGRNPDYEPCFHPELYIFGSGDGKWYFEGDELVIEYSGEGENTRAGTHRYLYEFNKDYTQLKVFGLSHDATWLKVPQEEE